MINKKGFFVFGLQRCGTNYMRQLMEMNFLEAKTRAAWKHAIEPHSKEHLDSKIEDRAILLMKKNPYTWIESIAKRNPVDYVRTQTTFPCKEFSNREERLLALNGFNLAALAKTWQLHHDNWIENMPNYIEEDATIIRYEDLLDSLKREWILQLIESRYSFTRQTEDWVNPIRVHMSTEFNEKRKSYYQNTGITLSRDQLDLINEHLNDESLRRFQYAKL